MRHLFAASTMFHILVCQAVAAGLRDQGQPTELLLWGPVARDEEIFVRWAEDYRALVLPDLWHDVHYEEQGTHDYDLHALWPDTPITGSWPALRKMRSSQRRLDRLVLADREPITVYVTNITAGAIDRHLAAAARNAPLGRVSYIEDGIADALSAVLKQTIDSRYWQARGHQRRFATGSAVRRTLLTLARVDSGAVELASRDYRTSFAFDDVYQLDVSAPPAVRAFGGRIVEVPDSSVGHVLDRVATRIPAPEEVASGSALYLSRPDSEDGLLSRASEIAAISGIIAELNERHDGRLLLKPHPRDSVAKVRAICDRSGVAQVPGPYLRIPAELAARALRAPACYGTWTGSLIYSQRFTGCQGVSVLPRLLAMVEGVEVARLGAIYQELARRFGRELQWLTARGQCSDRQSPPLAP